MSKESVWEFVIAKSDIVNVIGQYVNLIKQGKNYKACCPFHGEKTPSFIVSQEKGIFKCFGCGKSGNVIKFIEFKENLNGIEALKFLAKKQNLDISNFGDFLNNSNLSSEHSKIFEANQVALNFFRYQITFEKTSLLENFLQKRNLTKEIIKEFEIGFAAKDKSIYETLKNNEIDDYAIFNSSLLSGNENRNFFNDRLIFPIHDKFGNIVAFSGRDITGLGNPKYLNSSETIVFKKNEAMFNYYHAKDEIIKTNEVLIVEGQFDCIALWKIGIKNAIAIMGTSLSPYHLKELSNKTITLFFDNDQAGKNATLKSLRIILYYLEKYHLNINFIKNNLNKDPDELYNLDQGKTLEQLINQKIDLVEFIFNMFLEIHKSNNSEQTKFENYKQIFEYVYYLKEQLTIILQEKLQKNAILSEKLFQSYYKEHAKPNFPSDPFFKTKVFEKESSDQASINNKKEEIQQYQYFSNDLKNQNKISKLEIKKNNNKKNISAHGTLLKEILLITLFQPGFEAYFWSKNFEAITFDDSYQPLKDLINYVVNKRKEGIEINANNLILFLEADLAQESRLEWRKKIENSLEAAKEIKEITWFDENKNEDSYFLIKKIDDLINQKQKKPKKIIIKGVGNGK
ncbi:DNA primase [Metamycoplasma alkalescens]|uniref:DNA primase n=2 Tax=Metamycoplasma alkalescens TaxID=45363 RepID=A0A318U497_9BACT|nr:DNA primase [Metamycoplasma alkalescens]PYF42211.1 DNA primase [Metamycoplasma alkalescens]